MLQFRIGKGSGQQELQSDVPVGLDIDALNHGKRFEPGLRADKG